jgi:hypothetical protein
MLVRGGISSNAEEASGDQIGVHGWNSNSELTDELTCKITEGQKQR